MSAPLSRVYPERVELARRSPMLTVVPAVIVVSLLGIAGVGFAWSSAVRTKHAVTENYNSLELQDSNVKKNQFNITLLFGTIRLVQKNRLLDEPIFFYRPNDTAPMELVVDKLAKHRVSGRLIVP